ncbi:MAG: PspC domain-containing protein [Bacteroidota bacterium]
MTRRLYRSKHKVLGGVCAGIAEYFGWDPTLVRLAYLIISLVSAAFPGLMIYVVLWIVMPESF